MEQNFHPVISVRIFGEEKAFGPGIATLLQHVQKEHSLRAAAMAMGMAYSKAWTIVKASEAALGFKLLQSATGGKNGGGAILTPQAQQILATYQDYCSQLKAFAKDLFAEKFKEVL